MFPYALSIRVGSALSVTVYRMNKPIVSKQRLPWIKRLQGSFCGSLSTVLIASGLIGNAVGFLECLAIGSTWLLLPATFVGSVIPTKSPVASFLAGTIASTTGVYLLIAWVVSRL